MRKTTLLLSFSYLLHAREISIPLAQHDLFRLFTTFVDHGEHIHRRLSSNSHGPAKKKSKYHSKKVVKGGDGSPHGHDGEHSADEIIHDSASEFAEMAMVVIGITYVLFFVLTMLGYCLRSYQKNKELGSIAMMN